MNRLLQPARRRRLAAVAVLGSVFLAAAYPGVASASPTDPDNISSYPVAFTGGIGVYLRDAPSDSEESKIYAMPDGTTIPDECETTGVPRTNSYGQTSDVYVRAPGGVYVNSVFLASGVNGRTGAPDCADLDAARAEANTPRTVADYLRDGQRVVYTTDGPDRLRGYYSHEETATAARYLEQASGKVYVVNNVGCAVAGVLGTIATGGATLVVGGAVGAGLGLGCGAIAHNQVAPLASTATAADTTGKCLELRFHRNGEEWELDDSGWTMTDNSGYCG